MGEEIRRWRVYARVPHDEPIEEVITGTRQDAEDLLWDFLSSLGVETGVEEEDGDGG